jgi:site-specific DNA-methyltransferase (adenine-specific)/modification methylase
MDALDRAWPPVREYFYCDDSVCIIHGDCREIVPDLPKPGLILADVPYGISYDTSGSRFGKRLHVAADYPPVHGDDEPFDPAWLLDLGAPAMLWGANHFSSRLPDSGGWVVWDKERPHGLDQATAELAWTNYVKGVRVFRHLWNGMMRKSEHGESYHPTQKPVALMKWVLGLRWTPAEGYILDPYMGCGPVLRAAKDLGRKAIGIEIEERYCAIAANRMAQGVLNFG